MKYIAKSIIIGRKKRTDKTKEEHPCFVAIFQKNDPHKLGIAPDKILDFEEIHKVELKNCNVKYLLAGNDLVLNDLESFDLIHEGPHLFITVKQN